jgi:hypothetical protein
MFEMQVTETLSRLNAQVGGMQKQLAKVDEQVRFAQTSQAPNKQIDKAAESGVRTAGTGAADSGTFITTVDITTKVQEPTSQKDVKSVDELLCPDFTKAAALPGNVQVPNILKRLIDLWGYPADRVHQKVWVKGLGSKQTQEIIQDLFW